MLDDHDCEVLRDQTFILSFSFEYLKIRTGLIDLTFKFFKIISVGDPLEFHQPIFIFASASSFS